MILAFPQTVHLCFPEPLSITSSEQETPKLQSPSVSQELQSSKDRSTHTSSCPSQLCDQTANDYGLIKFFIQPSAILPGCSRFMEYSSGWCHNQALLLDVLDPNHVIENLNLVKKALFFIPFWVMCTVKIQNAGLYLTPQHCRVMPSYFSEFLPRSWCRR